MDQLFIDENGVVSLQIKEDIDLDLATRFYINTSNNRKLEVKYPSLENIDLEFLKGNNYLKRVEFRVSPKRGKNETNLCQHLLGIYPNVAFDPIKKVNKIVIQGFVPDKKLFCQEQIKIGDLIVSLNDVEVSYENIETLLSSIREAQSITIVALGPITYTNLDTHHIVLNNDFPDLVNKLQNKITKAPSKSTSVVKGDRVKAANDSISSDDLFFYAMILSLDQSALKRKPESKEKNDLIYCYPRVDSGHAYRKLNNTILSQLIEVIRGLFMTLSYAVKDINANDQAICSTIDYQGMILNVCFLHNNFGNKGLLVIIVPRDQIDQQYFKTLAKNLNDTYKFTFGSQTLNTMVNQDENLESKNMLRSELDAFFNHFHTRLIQSSLFKTFNANSKNLSFYDKVWCYNEMKTKVFDSMPFFELPAGLKIDLETVLSDLESQEPVDLGRNDSGYRRLFHVYGSCLFFQNNLLVSHFDESVTKLVFNFCDHYNYFNHTKNGNHFRIWREVEIERKLDNSRHFLVLIGLKDFIAAMIIESGGSIAKEIDQYKIVEPNNFYIQKLLYSLLDLDNSGLMMEVNQTLSSKTSKIFFNMDKFLVSKKKRLKMSDKKRSLSQSPIRLKDGRSRSLSQTKNQTECTHRPVVSASNDENESSDEMESINEKIYQTKSLSRHNSISDIGRMSFRGGNWTNTQDDNKIFNDLYLVNAVLYYASSDNGMNGVLFTPRHFDINSSLFQRFFYNYIQCCFNIKSLFEDVMELKFADDSCHQVMEQGVLLDMEIDDGKQPANKARKELNFWVVGRRRLQRNDSQSQWVVIGDFFVCFHDNLEDVVLELAFDLGFSKMSF